LPLADDDFAALVSEFDTMDQFRVQLAQDVKAAKERAQVSQAQSELVDHLLATLDFQAPKGVVESDAAAMLERQGKEEPTDQERDAARGESEKAIRAQLLADALVKTTQVSTTDRELVGFLANTAQGLGVDPSLFIDAAQRNGELPHFYAELMRQKALAQALTAVQVKDSEGNPVDIKSRLRLEEQTELGRQLAQLDGDAIENETVADAALLEEVEIDLAALANED
jgi:trigger factor